MKYYPILQAYSNSYFLNEGPVLPWLTGSYNVALEVQQIISGIILIEDQKKELLIRWFLASSLRRDTQIQEENSSHEWDWRSSLVHFHLKLVYIPAQMRQAENQQRAGRTVSGELSVLHSPHAAESIVWPVRCSG